MPDHAPRTPVMLYDGECGLCHTAVQFVLRHDRGGTLRFAALGSPFAQAVLQRHPELTGVDSMVWVEPPTERSPETVFVRSDGSLRVAAYLGGLWKMLLVLTVIPRPARDAIYRWVAANRRRVFRAPHCALPNPETRARFLDPGPTH